MTKKADTTDIKMKTEETKDRRDLLKGLVAGSAVVAGSKSLPDTWSKPLTDAVILPGHASTTAPRGGYSLGDEYGGDQALVDDAQGDREGYYGPDEGEDRSDLEYFRGDEEGVDTDYGEDDSGDRGEDNPGGSDYGEDSEGGRPTG